jgi:hypothetical protein
VTAVPAAGRYRFGAVDGGIWLGLRPVPLATLTAALTVSVVAMYVGAPLPVGFGVLAVALVIATVPVAGRPIVEWTPTAGRHAGVTLAGRRRWSAELLSPRPVAPPAGARLRLPREYGALRLLDIDGVGLLDDPAGRVAVGVLQVAGSDRFSLLDVAERDRLLAGWGSALAALAVDDRIRRVQWVERVAPEDRDATRWMSDRAVAGEQLEDYARLVDDVAAGAVRHDTWLAVALPRMAESGDASAAALADAAGILLTANLVARPVPAPELADLLRRAVDPQHRGFGGDVPHALRVAPASRRCEWDALQTDDSWHRSYAVTGWPRLPVTAGWLEPLLLAAPHGCVRTVSVHLRPVPPQQAMRRARAARARARLDVEDRSRFGMTGSAGGEAAVADATAAEEELVAGYRLQELSAVVTVTAPDPGRLTDACRMVRTAAVTARLDLRPLHGQHDLGFVATLPLCRVPGRSR